MMTKLRLAVQACEAVAYIHANNVLRCDINASNFVLDDALGLVICDFQGRLLDSDGSVRLDGGVPENPKSHMPCKKDDEANVETEIFALGSTVYHIMQGHIMQGHEPFPDSVLIVVVVI